MEPQTIEALVLVAVLMLLGERGIYWEYHQVCEVYLN